MERQEVESACERQMVSQQSCSPTPSFFLTPSWILHPPLTPVQNVTSFPLPPNNILFIILFILFYGSRDSSLYLSSSIPPTISPSFSQVLCDDAVDWNAHKRLFANAILPPTATVANQHRITGEISMRTE